MIKIIDTQIEAAIDAVFKTRGWRDRRWGDAAIGGFDYNTVDKKRYVIRDHEAEEREGKTVILFETEDYEKYELNLQQEIIRREVRAILEAVHDPVETADKDTKRLDWLEGGAAIDAAMDGERGDE